ncbi:enoyl-CoA hydratase/isomerase family protein [Motiliproteus sp. SC1-56]|uniref:enoyl-CoA hydratase/isomerase family protein n=1 Tax=Motiliproteus sp. SC1-56 TaxID=2799565 RepID=UPI001A8FD92E|nr:enoyl-CoA hydratase-related protein [Motiliproteus sp. SC1-56]
MSALSFDTVIYNKHAAHAEIRFNRPHRLNAVVEQFYRELIAALRQAEADPEVRAVLLTGEGRAFCVGADLKEHAAGERTPYQRRQYLQLGNDACETIFRLNKPVVAAVNGYALGAGAEMACSCDFVLMAEGAQLGFPEVSIGTFVGGGVTRFLPRLVGLPKARELMFLGERINGTEAARIGLVTRAVADEALQEEAQAFIAKLSTKAPISMALAKKLLNTSDESTIDAQLTRELDGLFMCTTTEDWKEGVAAFAEKRSPNFKGC